MQPTADEILALQEGAAALVAVYDQEDRLRYANAAYRDAYFLGPDEHPLWSDMMRRNFAAQRGSVIATSDLESWLAAAYTRRGKTPDRSFEIELADGRWLWVSESVRADGWLVTVCLDIADLRTSERELRLHRDLARRDSRTDELTGVANRRHMMFMLEALLKGEVIAGQCGGCVCLLDIDHFKRVNDIYGHQAGDTVLINFARTVQANIRSRDAFGRIGGEEFMLILPGSTPSASRTAIDRILAAVRSNRPLDIDPNFSVTCSAGLTEVVCGDAVEAVYSRADQALYRAKHEGRDQLRMAA